MADYQPLSPDRVNRLRWSRFSDYRHALHQHMVPVAAPELGRLAAELPLAFVRLPQGGMQLCAMLAVSEADNHCLDEHFRWTMTYVPALLRAHPFRVLPPDSGGSQRILCVDLESPWVNDDAAFPFFSEAGQLAPVVQQILAYLTRLEKHFYKTQRAVDALMEHELLIPWHPEGDDLDVTVPGLFCIDEKAFNALADADFQFLRKKGAVGIAYAQMISAHQMPMLIRRGGIDVLSNSHDFTSLFESGDDVISFDFGE